MSEEIKEEFLELFSSKHPKSPVFDEASDLDEDTDIDSSVRKHISIKVRQSDLDSLKKEAERRGLRYQSLINSILHQYVTGRLRVT